MLDPTAHEHILTAHPKCSPLIAIPGYHLKHFAGQFLSGKLVCIGIEYPRMLEAHLQRCRALTPLVIELPLHNPRSERPRDFHCSIGAVRIENDNVVTPGHRVETPRQVLLLIEREDQDADVRLHRMMVRRFSTRAGFPRQPGGRSSYGSLGVASAFPDEVRAQRQG